MILPRTYRTTVFLLLAAVAPGCAGSGDADIPSSVRLIDVFGEAAVTATPPTAPLEPILWDFAAGSSPGEDATATLFGARAIQEIEGLALLDGALVGRTTGESPFLHIPVPVAATSSDSFHSAEIRLRVSAGTSTGLSFAFSPEIDDEQVLHDATQNRTLAVMADVAPSDEFQTVTLNRGMANFMGTISMGSIRHLAIRPSDVADAEFAIESIRLVSRLEHLSSIPSGVGWHGLGEIYRETIVSRAPESIRLTVDVPTRPWLDLNLGTIERGPVTFVVSVADQPLLRRTISTPDRWESVVVDLSSYAGRRIELSLSTIADADGAIAYWGTPAVRQRGDSPRVAPPSAARAELVADTPPPRGVILILADTLRRDRLPWYGGQRDNAPNLAALAEAGTVFTSTVSQGTWTKVSVPSILTSLYPSAHGITDIIHRLPASVTTLEEVYQAAGYATFHTSSIPFTGQLTNLHQGAEVLHEAASVGDLDHSEAKTARTYTDRLLDWIDLHHESPFFVFLHVFDPHSPFEPYAPYDTLYTDTEEIAAHRERVEAAREHIVDDHMREDGLPTTAELDSAGIDPRVFVDTELDWYDASIKAMDVEIGRLLQRLAGLGIADDTVIAFMSDHGEAFLEHGKHFHGWDAYGEMLNIPLMLWWPGRIPAARSDTVIESINVYPTLLDLSRLEVPTQAQGQSLLPLMARPEAPAGLGWVPGPAFAERASIDSDEPLADEVEQLVIVADGWKLVHNTTRPEGKAEFELFDYANDPLDQIDVGPDNPDVVAQLSEELRAWHEGVLLNRVEPDSAEGLTEAERDRLRALGYIQ
ncbi:MAG TPA: sulfatase [Acidobacteriota bacterium]|nr:sulfatase [Acidobacteriota bacterium]